MSLCHFVFTKHIQNKKYMVYSGKNVTAPKNPSEEDKTFAGWKDGNDYLADFSVPVEQDVTYYAVWN